MFGLASFRPAAASQLHNYYATRRGNELRYGSGVTAVTGALGLQGQDMFC